MSSEDLVRESVMSGLRTMGDEVSRVVLYFLRTEHRIKLEDVVDNPERLGEGLKEILGDSGARLVMAESSTKAVSHPSHLLRYRLFMEGLKEYMKSLPSV
jgi:hypothetical protein